MSIRLNLNDAALKRLETLAEVSAASRHMKPVWAAVRAGCGITTLVQHQGPFLLPPQDRGNIVIIEDDTKESSSGPSAFHDLSIDRLAQIADTHAILSLAARPEVYAQAAKDALRGKFALIVETSPMFELPWLGTILTAAPGRTVLLDHMGPFARSMR